VVCCHASILKFENRLSRQDSASQTSLRFQETPSGLRIFAIDQRGKLTLAERPYPPRASRAFELEDPPAGAAEELDGQDIRQLEDA
jgi:hypothetical protein